MPSPVLLPSAVPSAATPSTADIVDEAAASAAPATPDLAPSTVDVVDAAALPAEAVPREQVETDGQRRLLAEAHARQDMDAAVLDRRTYYAGRGISAPPNADDLTLSLNVDRYIEMRTGHPVPRDPELRDRARDGLALRDFGMDATGGDHRMHRAMFLDAERRRDRSALQADLISRARAAVFLEHAGDGKYDFRWDTFLPHARSHPGYAPGMDPALYQTWQEIQQQTRLKYASQQPMIRALWRGAAAIDRDGALKELADGDSFLLSQVESTAAEPSAAPAAVPQPGRAAGDAMEEKARVFATAITGGVADGFTAEAGPGGITYIQRDGTLVGKVEAAEDGTLSAVLNNGGGNQQLLWMAAHGKPGDTAVYLADDRTRMTHAEEREWTAALRRAASTAASAASATTIIHRLGAAPDDILSMVRKGTLSWQTGETLMGDLYGQTMNVPDPRDPQVLREYLNRAPGMLKQWAGASHDVAARNAIRNTFLNQWYATYRDMPGVTWQLQMELRKTLTGEKAEGFDSFRDGVEGVAAFSRDTLGSMGGAIMKYPTLIGLRIMSPFSEDAGHAADELAEITGRANENMLRGFSRNRKKWFTDDGERRLAAHEAAARRLHLLIATADSYGGQRSPEFREKLAAAVREHGDTAWQMHQMHQEQAWKMERNDLAPEADRQLGGSLGAYLETGDPAMWEAYNRRILMDHGERQAEGQMETLTAGAGKWGAAYMGGIASSDIEAGFELVTTLLSAGTAKLVTTAAKGTNRLSKAAGMVNRMKREYALLGRIPTAAGKEAALTVRLYNKGVDALKATPVEMATGAVEEVVAETGNAQTNAKSLVGAAGTGLAGGAVSTTVSGPLGVISGTLANRRGTAPTRPVTVREAATLAAARQEKEAATPPPAHAPAPPAVRPAYLSAAREDVHAAARAAGLDDATASRTANEAAPHIAAVRSLADSGIGKSLPGLKQTLADLPTRIQETAVQRGGDHRSPSSSSSTTSAPQSPFSSQSVIRDATLDAIADGLSRDLPQVDWRNGTDGVLDAPWAADPALLPDLLPIAIAGKATALHGEHRAATFAAATDAQLRAIGIPDADIPAIRAGLDRSPHHAAHAIEGAFTRLDPHSETARAAQAEIASADASTSYDRPSSSSPDPAGLYRRLDQRLPVLEIPDIDLPADEAGRKAFLMDLIRSELGGKTIVNADSGISIFFNSGRHAMEQAVKGAHSPNVARGLTRVADIVTGAVHVNIKPTADATGRSKTKEKKSSRTLEYHYFMMPVRIGELHFAAWFNARKSPSYKALVFDSFGLAELPKTKKVPNAETSRNSTREDPRIDSPVIASGDISIGEILRRIKGYFTKHLPTAPKATDASQSASHDGSSSNVPTVTRLPDGTFRVDDADGNEIGTALDADGVQKLVDIQRATMDGGHSAPQSQDPSGSDRNVSPDDPLSEQIRSLFADSLNPANFETYHESRPAILAIAAANGIRPVRPRSGSKSEQNHQSSHTRRICESLGIEIVYYKGRTGEDLGFTPAGNPDLIFVHVGSVHLAVPSSWTFAHELLHVAQKDDASGAMELGKEIESLLTPEELAAFREVLGRRYKPSDFATELPAFLTGDAISGESIFGLDNLVQADRIRDLITTWFDGIGKLNPSSLGKFADDELASVDNGNGKPPPHVNEGSDPSAPVSPGDDGTLVHERPSKARKREQDPDKKDWVEAKAIHENVLKLSSSRMSSEEHERQPRRKMLFHDKLETTPEERMILKSKYEIVLVYSKEGRLLTSALGWRTGSRIPLLAPGEISSHNHPGGRGPSATDIRFALDNPRTIMRIVARNENGETEIYQIAIKRKPTKDEAQKIAFEYEAACDRLGDDHSARRESVHLINERFSGIIEIQLYH